MNRKNLTAAVLAGLAGAVGIVGSAQAVNVNPDGLGQVLLYPYYTTNGGNQTLLTVVNTTDEAKAVKVRFSEGENSREVLDFNLYMSAWDVWTAAIVDLLGTPVLYTEDTSCTVPYIYGNGGAQEFLPWALDDSIYRDVLAPGCVEGGESCNADLKGPNGKYPIPRVYDDISRAREGHFNMIEMGTIIDEQTDNLKWVNVDVYENCIAGSLTFPVTYGNPATCAADRAWTSAELKEPATNPTYGTSEAVTHGSDGMPADCQQLVDAWTRGADSADDGYWIDTPMADIQTPSGGMFGSAGIVNVAQGVLFSYDATAVDGFYVGEGSDLDQNYIGDESHQEPGTILPSLDSGNTTDATVFLNGGLQTADWDYDILDGDGDTRVPRSVDAVSYVFMHDQVMNTYTTEDSVAAGTEWVITFPTKQFYVHQDFLNDYAEFRQEADAGQPDAPIVPLAPFKSTWTWENTVYVGGTGDDKEDVKTPGYVDRPCEVVALNTIWDREEQTIIDPELPPGTVIPPIVSPAPPIPDLPDPDGIIPFELCYETSVIAFGDPRIFDDRETTPILNSRNFHNIDNTLLGFEYGWARLDMQITSFDEEDNGVVIPSERDMLGGLFGLPVTGFAVERFLNFFVGEGVGTLANYGGIVGHKYTRTIESRDVDDSGFCSVFDNLLDEKCYEEWLAWCILEPLSDICPDGL
jgi:hypothetical protein